MAIGGTSVRAFLGAGALLVFSACSAPPASNSGAVSLDAASSKPVYAKGEPVAVSLNLRNDTGVEVYLSAMANGTLSVVSLTRDGIAVPPREAIAKFDEDMGHLLRKSVRKVGAGKSLVIAWTSFEDPVQSGQALQTVRYRSGTANPALLYLVGLPGRYDLTLRYEFPAAAAASGSAVQNPAISSTIRFTVSP